jgi:hypothetical protein
MNAEPRGASFAFFDLRQELGSDYVQTASVCYRQVVDMVI